jgi:hypothetical protein
VSLESIAPQFYAAPSTKIDGIPAAITSDLGIANDLSDRGTGIGFDKPWTQEQIESVGARAALNVAPERVSK